MKQTIGIVGSRRRDTVEDLEYCTRVFFQFYRQGDEIVSGGCPQGGDRFAEVIAKTYEIPIKIYYAEWRRLGRGAGIIRNTYIAQDSNILIAVVAPDRTGGTEDTIKKALKMDKIIVIVKHHNIEIINEPHKDNLMEVLKE